MHLLFFGRLPMQDLEAMAEKGRLRDTHTGGEGHS